MAIETKGLTHSQVKRKVTAATKAWIKAEKLTHIQVQCIRGTFHITNADQYWLTAQDVLQAATGLEFNPQGNFMARLKHDYNDPHNLIITQ